MVSVFDPVGRLVYESEWEAEIGEPIEQQLNLSFLQNGIYYYWIQNGEEIIGGRLVVL